MAKFLLTYQEEHDLKDISTTVRQCIQFVMDTRTTHDTREAKELETVKTVVALETEKPKPAPAPKKEEPPEEPSSEDFTF